MRFLGFFNGLLLGFGAIFDGVYKGSFRIDFWVLEAVFVFFFFWWYFLGIFNEVLGIF